MNKNLRILPMSFCFISSLFLSQAIYAMPSGLELTRASDDFEDQFARRPLNLHTYMVLGLGLEKAHMDPVFHANRNLSIKVFSSNLESYQYWAYQQISPAMPPLESIGASEGPEDKVARRPLNLDTYMALGLGLQKAHMDPVFHALSHIKPSLMGKIHFRQLSLVFEHPNIGKKTWSFNVDRERWLFDLTPLLNRGIPHADDLLGGDNPKMYIGVMMDHNKQDLVSRGRRGIFISPTTIFQHSFSQVMPGFKWSIGHHDFAQEHEGSERIRGEEGPVVIRATDRYDRVSLPVPCGEKKLGEVHEFINQREREFLNGFRLQFANVSIPNTMLENVSWFNESTNRGNAMHANGKIFLSEEELG